MTEPANYKDTLNLPKTNFDMKANLTTREPAMVKQWSDQNLYQKIRQRPHPKGKWILHDGPPYANGDIHMGHLINKVLKDIVVKFRTMQGHDSPYVPGWDCHGLPIESAIQKSLGPKFRELSKDEVRKQCHDYAMKYVKLQSDSFQRLGVFFGPNDTDRYLTLNPKYESGILEVLAELVQRDLVYRQKKPVHWCTFDRTALAEAELEYQTKKDSSVYVCFSVEDRGGLPGVENDKPYFSNVELMIWTTTPWTLPANRAVAVHPDHEYVLVSWGDVEVSGSHYTVMAKELVERVLKNRNLRNVEISKPFTGREWVAKNPTYRHPFDASRIQPVVLADYVTLEDGTGLVHTAPGHGKEDYMTGIKNNLEIYNPVLPDGRYDDTVPEFLRGKLIFDANQLVIDKLKETGALFHHQLFDHEYPHCWRCKKPVIFRATEQWFVKASSETRPSETRPSGSVSSGQANQTLPDGRVSDLWSNAKSFVNSVQWIPTWGKNRIDGMLDTRPDWCISRQRSWGVPIPAFFDPQGKCLLTAKTVQRIADYFKQNGADSWYTHTPAQLLGIDPAKQAEGLQSLGLPTDLDITTLDKGQDILDVWFESGASHHAVLECTHPELGYPADMYLEGSDQHRGWFQSSLLEASGYKPVPPFKQVLTHGFIVDEKGLKYSKSSGNYVPVDKMLQQHGADVLRLWVSSVDYQNDIKFGPSLLATISEAYRKIRNTIRYLLGNLYDFDPTKNTTAPRPHSIDQWMQNKLDAWSAEVYRSYDTYEFHNAFKLIYEFCNVEISAVYAKAIKDRLYCELPDSPKRRASQTVCFDALQKLIKLCAPVLVFTSEESWAEVRNFPGCATLVASIHLATITSPEEGRMESEVAQMEADMAAIRAAIRNQTPSTSTRTKAAKHWEVLMPLIEKGNKQLDDLKKSIGLGNPLDAEAVIILPSVADEVSKLIADYAPEIEDALGVGFHRIEHGEIWDIKIEDTRNKYPSCARSWKRRPDVGSNKTYPDLSARDATVVQTLRSPKSA